MATDSPAPSSRAPWVRMALAVVAGMLLVAAFAWPRHGEAGTGDVTTGDDPAASMTAGPASTAGLAPATSPTTAATAAGEATTVPATTVPATTAVTAPATTAPASTAGTADTASASAPIVAAAPGAPVDPSWPHTVTLVTDSVGLGAKDKLTETLGAAGWLVDVRGRPALMVNKADAELKAAAKPVGSVVIVALGYNSLWEKDRANFQKWSDRFDGQAEDIYATLRSLGAKKVVWVTLREPDVSIVPPKAMKQFNSYAWYFPYVNERIHAFHDRHPEVGIADWAAVSNVPGITYDAIHLNPKGARLMVATMRGAAGV